MNTNLPSAVADAISRITTPSDDPVVTPAELTGALAAMDSWWTRLAGDAPVVVDWVTTGADEADCTSALVAGLTAAERAVDAGATLLIPRIPRTPTEPPDHVVARAVIGLLTKRDASSVLGQPVGMPDAKWMAECARIRDTMAEHRALLGEHLALLDALDARAISTAAGVLIGAAARRTPCIVDGTGEWAAALVADRLAHRARHWWRAASTSSDPARIAARDRTDVTAGIPLDLDDDEGWGARASIAMLTMTHETRAQARDRQRVEG